MATRESNLCALTHRAAGFNQNMCRAHLPAPLCGGYTPHLSGWGRLGQSAHVVQQYIWTALYAYLFLSLLSPLCVFLMGISVRCTGVQSHCGLKRISDDRKYVNLLFPLGQGKKYKGSMDDEDNTCALYSVFQQKILRGFSFKKYFSPIL